VPGAPTTLAQFRENGTTALPVGGVNNTLTAVLKGSVTDPDPGDQLRLEVTMDRIKRGIGKFTGRALIDGELACEAELMCALHKAKEDA